MSLCKKPQCHNIFALHGFLGLPTDWELFDSITHPIGVENDGFDLWHWSRSFNSSVKKTASKNILIGYSLGGRLAMHSLISNPDLWDAAIIISANPGLQSVKEREARLISDEHWAQRFLNDPWAPLMHDWNANAVFGNRPFPYLREESAFDRKQLSSLLVNWSLGKQESLHARLKQLSLPILYLAGEHDKPFCSIADQFRDFAEVSIIPDAAHRVPWDNPKNFMNKIDIFIGGL
ncbi:MAG: alpha/beta fold hydrolase [Parachlamydiaceae bacterium]|nr:alpha/beta fold hydrolase [Parachlamydiaceae bacterium]